MGAVSLIGRYGASNYVLVTKPVRRGLSLELVYGRRVGRNVQKRDAAIYAGNSVYRNLIQTDRPKEEKRCFCTDGSAAME